MKLSDFLVYRGTSAELVIIAIFIGIEISVICSFFRQLFITPFVSALFKAECHDAKSSLTLGELKLGKKRLLKLLLRMGMCKRLISVSKKSERDGEGCPGGNIPCYYISKEKQDKAEALYISPKIKPKFFPLIILGIPLLLYLILLVLPTIINYVNYFLSYSSL